MIDIRQLEISMVRRYQQAFLRTAAQLRQGWREAVQEETRQALRTNPWTYCFLLLAMGGALLPVLCFLAASSYCWHIVIVLVILSLLPLVLF